MTSEAFISALESRDLHALRAIPKADLHNHGCLGYTLDELRAWTEMDIPDPPIVMPTFDDFVAYLRDHLHRHLYSHDGFLVSIDAAIRQAQTDGVTELEISIDAQVVPEFASPQAIADAVFHLAGRYPSVTVRPEVGINREWDRDTLEAWVMPMVETGAFAAIDLYGHEMRGAPENFIECYALAKQKGMRCKAHAGEYLGPDFIRRSIEVLALDEVQHGIHAAESPELMRWLADHGIRLNICPTSNIRLGRVPNLAAHPVRRLYDAGVHVTINSDDIMVFDQTVSEEFLNLYEAGVFTAEELDDIRVRALRD